MKAASFITIALLGVVGYSFVMPKNNHGISSSSKNVAVQTKLDNQIKEVKSYAAANHYNQEVAFLIDLSIPSNQYRFFVVDLKNNKILSKGLVAHGSGSEKGKTRGKLKFSNEDGSYCSSLGKYIVKESYDGKFGKAYRLAGLDKTNSNAMSRAIVLHQYSTVPEKEVASPIVLSLGCPMVSPGFFSTLETYIDKPRQNIVLYMYE